MNSRDLSPWARRVLTPDEKLRLELHHAPGWKLHVGSLGSPYRFVVELRQGDRTLRREDVGRLLLFQHISSMLAEAGHPLEVTA